MYYEINVAKMEDPSKLAQGVKPGYKHLFATHPRSLSNINEVKVLISLFVEKFPSPEYNISVSYNPEVERNMSIEAFLEDPNSIHF
jgi:hypothetical protein